MTGKLVDQREVTPTEVSELQVGDRYPSGVYNVIVTQGENTKTLRVIKRQFFLKYSLIDTQINCIASIHDDTNKSKINFTITNKLQINNIPDQTLMFKRHYRGKNSNNQTYWGSTLKAVPNPTFFRHMPDYFFCFRSLKVRAW